MGGIVFQMEGTSFLSGRGATLGGIGFDWGVPKKLLDGGGGVLPCSFNYGKPWEVTCSKKIGWVGR